MNITDTLNSRGFRYAEHAVRLLCLAAVILLLMVGITVYHASVPSLLIFTLFIIFYVQLPGQLMLGLAGYRPPRLSGLLCTGFFTGWALITLEYFLTELIHTNLLLYIAGPALSALYLILYARRLRRGRFSGQERLHPLLILRDISPAFCIFFVISFLFSLLLTQYLYLAPQYDEMISMNADKGFHIGLINSLSHGYPLECPWFSGLYFNYHIFTELLLSIPVRLFDLTADVVLLSCGPLLTAYSFCVSLYALFREMTSRPQRAGLYCLAVLLANLFICREPDASLAFPFIFRNENVAGYGISCTIAFLLLLRWWYQDIRSGSAFAWKKFLPLLALLMLTTGIKGPFGLILLGSLWGTFLLGLILRQVKLRMILPMVLMSLGFLLIYLTVLGSKGQGSSDLPLFDIATILDITFYKDALVTLMKSAGLPLSLRYAVLLVVFVVFLITAFFLPFVMGYLRELYLVLTRKKEFDFPRITIYAACMLGIICILFLNYYGHSQVYFGFATVFLAPLIAFWFFEDMEENRGLVMGIVRVLFFACLIVTSAGLFLHMAGLVDEAKEASSPTDNARKYLSMSHEEYEAMRWIDRNTPRDSLLATDRYYSISPEKYDVQDRWHNRFFLYSDYSNRICYLAGSGYNLPAKDWALRQERIINNERLYDPSDAERGDLARELGIDYVVISKRFTHAGDLENKDYELCFSNEDVDVYKVRK